jgi:hypothetical protein
LIVELSLVKALSIAASAAGSCAQRTVQVSAVSMSGTHNCAISSTTSAARG